MAFTEEQIADLDKGMKRQRATMKAAEKGALEACEAGDLDASADLWDIVGLSAQIMAVGRRMKDREGNAIAPQSGAK